MTAGTSSWSRWRRPTCRPRSTPTRRRLRDRRAVRGGGGGARLRADPRHDPGQVAELRLLRAHGAPGADRLRPSARAADREPRAVRGRVAETAQANRNLAADIAAGPAMFNQKPEIIRHVLSNPRDRVTYGGSSPDPLGARRADGGLARGGHHPAAHPVRALRGRQLPARGAAGGHPCGAVGSPGSRSWGRWPCCSRSGTPRWSSAAASSSRPPGRWRWAWSTWPAQGLLLKHVVASLFRVTWGYLLAAALAIPVGMLMGWFGDRARRPQPARAGPAPDLADRLDPARDPVVRGGDLSPIFLIFLSSLFPMVVGTAAG